MGIQRTIQSVAGSAQVATVSLNPAIKPGEMRNAWKVKCRSLHMTHGGGIFQSCASSAVTTLMKAGMLDKEELVHQALLSTYHLSFVTLN